MKRTSTPRRGNCLTGLVIALAVLGLLLLIGGAVAFVTNNPTTAMAQLQTEVTALADGATAIEAPATVDIEMKPGYAAFILSPTGTVGDKNIPMPPVGVDYTITLTDPEGNPVQIETNTAQRRASDVFYFFGFCELKTEGTYKVTVAASDGSTPAAILATRAGPEELKRLGGQLTRVSIGGVGGCAGVCGLAMFVVFGVIALFMRKKSQPDPLAM